MVSRVSDDVNFQLIDNLTYNYSNDNKSNQLLSVTDSSLKNLGFTETTSTADDYTYYLNGNMISDVNKSITSITYNHLNLPVKITFATTGNIVYIYNANGVKLSKTVNKGTCITTITDYLGGFQYESMANKCKRPGSGYNGVLKFFPTTEGYVEPQGSSYNYVYQYKDHLGNIRLSYDKTLAIKEESNYYPFGLKHEGYNIVKTGIENKYKYNGKELQDELSLNLYDYGARNYDPALGRWMNIDPLAEVSRRWTPYNYAYNNPVIFVDPDGMLATYNWNGPNKGQYTDNGTVVTFGEAMASHGMSTDGSQKGDDPKIISRKEWGAKKPITKGREYEQIKGNLSVYYNTITVHHSGNEDNALTIQELQLKEQNGGYADIPYHFAIDGKGNIYEGRPLNIKGSHVKGGNTGNIGIVLLADLDSQDRGLNILFKAIEKVTGDGEASTEMIQSLVNLTQYLNTTYGIQYYGGHQEAIPSRYCPGNMGMEWVERIRQTFKMQKPIMKN